VARERAAGDEIEKEVRERELSSIIDTQIIKNWTITKVYFVDKKIENSGALLLSIRDITKLYYNKFSLHRHYKIVS